MAPSSPGPVTRRIEWVAYLFLLPQLLGFLVFGAYPLVSNLVLSTFRWSVLDPPKFTGLSNIETLINDPVFWRSFLNTVVYAVAYVVPTLVVSLLLAVLLNQRIRGISFFRTAYYVPVVTSYVVAAIIWNWMFDFDVGLLNYYLGLLGLPAVRWLLDPNLALYSLVLMAIWKNAGYTILIYLAALQNVPTEVVEAAQLDGAGRWQAFRYVTLPHLRPTTFLVSIMLTIWAFQAFVQPYLMTQGGPVNSTNTLVYYLYQKGFVAFDMGYAALVATALTLLVIVITLVQRKYSSDGYEPG